MIILGFLFRALERQKLFKLDLLNIFNPWSSLVEGDEGCIGPCGKLLCL